MKPALAPLAAALIAAACSAASGPRDQPEATPSQLARGAADDCLARSAGVLPSPRLEERRAAVVAATSPGRLEQVARIAGEQPARVVDRAEVLAPAAERRLAARSRILESKTGDQLVVVTVPDLGGMSIEQFGLALGNRWGIGRADLDNGVLLLVAPKNQRVRLEVGCGLEHVLTDARAAEIVGRMIPFFRRGDFESGVAAGSAEVEAALRARPERRDAGL